MLVTFDKASKLISDGNFLHVAGTEDLIKKLPKGNWIGGSTEFFMDEAGGLISNELLSVFDYGDAACKISTYDVDTIPQVTIDAFDNGYTILILPFKSKIGEYYADKASEFEGMYIKNIVGWVAGINKNVPGQTPIVVNGITGEVFTDKAVALHVPVEEGATVNVAVVNIFAQDENSPVFRFPQAGFSFDKCTVDGEEVVLADYLEQNNIDTRAPLVGDYSGAGINVAFSTIENGVVRFSVPVFPHIEYKLAKPIDNYAEEFRKKVQDLKDLDPVFSCNCVLNFMYGSLEGKKIDAFFGPFTFGEIAYQLVNQTLVYVTVS